MGQISPCLLLLEIVQNEERRFITEKSEERMLETLHYTRGYEI